MNLRAELRVHWTLVYRHFSLGDVINFFHMVSYLPRDDVQSFGQIGCVEFMTPLPFLESDIFIDQESGRYYDR